MTDPAASWDQIHIRELKFRCLIGTLPEERMEKQDVIVNVTLWADLRAACRSDRIEDTVDYKAVKKEILAMGEQSRFHLIETLAQQIADLCLANERIRQVRVCVEKPAALRFARTVAVEIVRTQGDRP